MNSVVGDGNGMAKRAPVRGRRQCARRLERLWQFPHAGHERRFLRTLHQANLPILIASANVTALATTRAPIKRAPDLFFLLAKRPLGARNFSLCNAPLPHRASRAARL